MSDRKVREMQQTEFPFNKSPSTVGRGSTSSVFTGKPTDKRSLLPSPTGTNTLKSSGKTFPAPKIQVTTKSIDVEKTYFQRDLNRSRRFK